MHHCPYISLYTGGNLYRIPCINWLYGSQLLSVHITSRTITSCTLFYTEIFCLMLPPLESGQIDYSPDMTDPFEFNSRASHVCEEGYFLEGNQVRSCSGDGLSTIGNWNGETPICTGRYVCIRVKWCTDTDNYGCVMWQLCRSGHIERNLSVVVTLFITVVRYTLLNAAKSTDSMHVSL